MSLPNDFCRCHDEKCPLNINCTRFIQRNKGYGDNIVQALSLRNGPLDVDCREFIPEKFDVHADAIVERAVAKWNEAIKAGKLPKVP